MDIFGQFGIEVKSLIEQIFNFVILLVILQKLLYKPLIDILEKRKKDIEDSAKKLENIEKKSQELKEKTEDDLADAREKSQEIIARAEKQASETRKKAQAEAHEQANEIISHAKKSIEAEKESLIDSVQKEIVQLVIGASGKVLGREIKNSQEEFISTEIKKTQS